MLSVNLTFSILTVLKFGEEVCCGRGESSENRMTRSSATSAASCALVNRPYLKSAADRGRLKTE